MHHRYRWCIFQQKWQLCIALFLLAGASYHAIRAIDMSRLLAPSSVDRVVLIFFLPFYSHVDEGRSA